MTRACIGCCLRSRTQHIVRPCKLSRQAARCNPSPATGWRRVAACVGTRCTTFYSHCAPLLQGAYQVPQQLTAALETLGTAKGSSLFNTLLHDQTKKQQRLLELQEQLGKRLDPPCNLSHLTVNETVRKLVLANREDFASNVKDEMGMSDERYIWVGVSAMAAKGAMAQYTPRVDRRHHLLPTSPTLHRVFTR